MLDMDQAVRGRLHYPSTINCRDEAASMPDKTQESHLKRRLIERRDLMRREIAQALRASADERHRELAGAVHDAGDDSVADLLVDVNIKGMDRDARELAAIGGALDRMARGQYGVCADCGADIGYARLEAQPAAARCVECETRHERQFAHERGRKL
jgi:RNA polymerase-binding protein DksA